MTPPPASPGRKLLDSLFIDPDGLAAFVRTVHAAHRRHRGAIPADELLQETARRALASADGFAGTTREQLLAWVRVIAGRVAADAVRSRPPLAPLPGEVAGGAEPPSAPAERGDEWARVRRVLDRLPARDRALLLARYRDGLDAGRIARVVGLSAEAVRQRLSRLLRQVRADAG